MDKVQRYVALLSVIMFLLVNATTMLYPCEPLKKTGMSMEEINQYIQNDATEPYLNTVTLPLLKLMIKNPEIRIFGTNSNFIYDYSIYGKQFVRYARPEIPDSLKHLFYVVDIKKHFNLYSIFGWRNDSLKRIISVFDVFVKERFNKKIIPGNFYDFKTYDVSASVAFSYINFEYGFLRQPNPPTANIIYEWHYGYFNTNSSTDVKGPYTRIKPHQSWYEP